MLSPEANRRGLMRSVARRDVPIALAITGLIVLIVGGVNFLTSGIVDVVEYVPDMIVAATLLGTATIVRRGLVDDARVPWASATAMTLVVAWLLSEFWAQPGTANMADVVIVMATFGPLVLAWPPFIAASASMTVGALAVLVHVGWGDPRGRHRAACDHGSPDRSA